MFGGLWYFCIGSWLGLFCRFVVCCVFGCLAGFSLFGFVLSMLHLFTCALVVVIASGFSCCVLFVLFNSCVVWLRLLLFVCMF